MTALDRMCNPCLMSKTKSGRRRHRCFQPYI
jgi:hypothetical protein